MQYFYSFILLITFHPQLLPIGVNILLFGESFVVGGTSQAIHKNSFIQCPNEEFYYHEWISIAQKLNYKFGESKGRLIERCVVDGGEAPH